MKRSTLGRAAVLPAVVLTTGLAACGAANESGSAGGGSPSSEPAVEGASGTLSGAGASSQAAAMEAWIAAMTDIYPDLQVNYDPAGSGAGREQFTAGAVAFAGSDAYLDDEEMAAATEQCGGEVIELPDYISPIAVTFNLEGVDTLNLSPATIAGIFNQQITTWDDPAIAADNPDTEMPATAITPVNRSDESGTTENFTEYLAAAAPDAWPHEPSGDWPVSGGEAAQGTSGVIGAIEAGNGAIGYADASQVGDLGVAAVGVGDGFVEYSPEAAAAVVDSSERVAGRGEYDYAIDIARDTTDSGNYPIVLVSYHVACTTYDDQQTADNVKALLTYVVSEEGQQTAADAAGSAPISADARADAMTAIDAISAG